MADATKSRRNSLIGFNTWRNDFDWLTIPPYDVDSNSKVWCRLCRKEISNKKDNVFKHAKTRKHTNKLDGKSISDSRPSIKVDSFDVSKDPTNIKITVPPDFFNPSEAIEVVATDTEMMNEASTSIRDACIASGIIRDIKNEKGTGNDSSQLLTSPNRFNASPTKYSYVPHVDYAPDADKNFLLSLHEDMKTLSNPNKLKFKRKVLQLMEQLLYDTDSLE